MSPKCARPAGRFMGNGATCCCLALSRPCLSGFGPCTPGDVSKGLWTERPDAVLTKPRVEDGGHVYMFRKDQAEAINSTYLWEVGLR